MSEGHLEYKLDPLYSVSSSMGKLNKGVRTLDERTDANLFLLSFYLILC